jgi:O-antigen ligase
VATSRVGRPPSGPTLSARQLAAAATLAAIAAFVALRLGYTNLLTYYGSLVIGAVAIGYLLWRADPAWTLTLAIVLTPFSGRWTNIGLPGGYVAPDRFLVIGAIGAIALRGPWMERRPPLLRHVSHVLMGLAVLYAFCSAAVSGTTTDQNAVIKLLEAFGVLPFVVFFVAPAAFNTARARSVLVGGMVALGAYLSLTALFETIGATQFVVPSYINDRLVGIHFGRARGPFVEAVTNGVALYACGIGCVIALVTWRSRLARAFAAVTLIGCTAGMLFTLQRSVWLGAIVASLVAALAAHELRRYIVPVAVVAVVAVGTAIVAIPGLNTKVTERAGNNQTIWDRKNLNTAARNIVAAKPLVGVGWGNFVNESADYFQQSDSFPLSATRLEVHNLFLGYAATLGLIGVALWGAALLTGVGSALLTRGPPELRPWRIGLIAYAVFFAIVANFVPPQVFPNLMLWLWAGVVWSGRLPRPPSGSRA